MSDRLAVLPQYLLPKQALTRLMGTLAGLEGGSLTTAVIRWFIQRYQVNMSEALDSDPAAYATFNQFFTRPLRPGRCRLDLPRRWRRQPAGRHHRRCRRPDLSGQRPPLQHPGAGRRRCTAGRAICPRALCHHLSEPTRLPPHPHALHRAPAAHDPRPR